MRFIFSKFCTFVVETRSQLFNIKFLTHENTYIDSLLDFQHVDTPCLAILPVQPTGGQWQTVGADVIDPPSGIHDLYIVFCGSGYDFDWWKLE